MFIKKRVKKKGQMELSFGMIFSIILIIIFIAFAVYALIKFLSIQRTAEIATFINDFQTDINKMWQGSSGSQQKTYSLPSRVEKVCLIDYSMSGKGETDVYDELEQYFYEKENLFFYPAGSGDGIDAKEIQHLDIKKITQTKNPYCLINNGKVSFTIKKDLNEALVKIE